VHGPSHNNNKVRVGCSSYRLDSRHADCNSCQVPALLHWKHKLRHCLVLTWCSALGMIVCLLRAVCAAVCRCSPCCRS
jgi:hypothetical protein